MRALYLTSFVLYLAATTFTQTHAQSKVVTALDEYFTRLGNDREISGSVLVVEKGKVVYEKSFGYADIDTKRLNTPDSEFHLASIAKVFTATAVLQLYEKGSLGLNDKYSSFFPDFPYPDVTIRQMLSHTSGLPEFTIFDKAVENDPNTIFANKDIIPTLKASQVALRFQPGEKWFYNNPSFSLLALLVEKLSGQTFEQYLQRNIFGPAKMSSTYIRTSLINTRPRPNIAFNHAHPFLFSSELAVVNKSPSTPRHKRIFYNEAFIGHSNIYSTTGDLLRFDAALRANVLLRKETSELAFTPTRLNSGEINRHPPGPTGMGIGGIGISANGLGWFVLEDTSAGKIVWHSGGLPGAATILLRNIDRDQTVVVLDNGFSTGLYRKGMSAMNILNGRAPIIVKKSLARIYGRSLMANGAETAIVRLNELKDDKENYNVDEVEFNNMAYDMMYKGHKSQALETFKINTLLFPSSDNIYHSYAEGLLEIGKRAESIAMLKKALKINPENQDAKKMIEKLTSEKPSN